jgi:acyl carrier protein
MPELIAPPRPATREEFTAELLAFICGPLSTRRRAPAVPGCITASTPLFESGLIDSLAIIDLLAFVEAATGRRIPMRQIDMRYFGTVERIAQTFGPTSGGVES